MIELVVFDDVFVMNSLTVQNAVHVVGNATVNNNMQINADLTVQSDIQVNGSQTIQGSLQVNGSQSVAGNLGAGDTLSTVNRVVASAQALVPSGAATLQQVRYYATNVANMPGLVLKGTDGFNYVLFIDTTGGTVNIGIQRA
ncbi:autotransporter outer membrane beta-barrel domain-containing protein [Paenibacillus aurantiacus]|uniref:Autotransporter outer membrane beta-barrel domain-containing protein n=1 Tax=Paenibacillus aurantiacus TaxID=1936118 RepID=A0ABV5KMT9_9BACL